MEILASEVKESAWREVKRSNLKKRALEQPALQAKVVTKMCHFALQFPPMFAVPPFTFFQSQSCHDKIQFSRPN